MDVVDSISKSIDNLINTIDSAEETAKNYLSKIDNIQEYATEKAQEKLDDMCEKITNEINVRLEAQRDILIGNITQTVNSATANIEALEPIANFDFSDFDIGKAQSLLESIVGLYLGPYRKAVTIATTISTEILPKLAQLTAKIQELSNIKDYIPKLKSKDGTELNLNKLNIEMEPITESEIGLMVWVKASLKLDNHNYRSVCVINNGDNGHYHILGEDGVFAYGSFPNFVMGYNSYIKDNFTGTWCGVFQNPQWDTYFLNTDGKILVEIPSTGIELYEELESLTSPNIWNILFGLSSDINAISSNGRIYFHHQYRNLLDNTNGQFWNNIYVDEEGNETYNKVAYVLSKNGYLAILGWDNDWGNVQDINIISQEQRLDLSKTWQSITKVKPQDSSLPEYFIAIASGGFISKSDDAINWTEPLKLIDLNTDYILLTPVMARNNVNAYGSDGTIYTLV